MVLKLTQMHIPLTHNFFRTTPTTASYFLCSMRPVVLIKLTLTSKSASSTSSASCCKSAQLTSATPTTANENASLTNAITVLHDAIFFKNNCCDL